MNDQFHFLGTGSIHHLKGILEKERARKIFLVTDQDAYEKSGAREKLAPVLEGYEVEVFSGVEPNPTIEQIKKGVDAFRKSQANLILAVGGGSVLDTAKTLNVLSLQEGEPTAYVVKEKEVVHRGKPLVAIPTTAGTGAEATHFAVVYIDKIKHSFAHPFVLPPYAIVDAQLTFSLPPRITAVTGMDALAQAIESFWSVKATDESKQYSREAITLILPNLATAVNNPTLETREAMAKGAYLSGKAINIAQTTACHAISYSFTTHFGVPHGHAVALTLPEMIVYNEKAMKQEARAELFSLLDVQNGAEAAERIRNLMQEIGLETTLSQLDITDAEQVTNFVLKEVNPERLNNNPRTLTQDELRAILSKIS